MSIPVPTLLPVAGLITGTKCNESRLLSAKYKELFITLAQFFRQRATMALLSFVICMRAEIRNRRNIVDYIYLILTKLRSVLVASVGVAGGG